MHDSNAAPSTEMTCPFCQSPTSADYNFCTTCYQQTKCISCEAKIFPGAPFCLKCSKPLISQAGNDKAPNRAVRKVKKEGENYEEYTDFALSDTAVEKLAPYVIGTTLPGRRVPPPQNKGLTGGQDNQGDEVDFEEISDDVDDTQNNSANSGQAESKSSAPNNPLSQFFKVDKGGLVAVENDFKGTSWKEQQQNFIILYAKAYKDLLNKSVPSKDVIREAAKKLNIIDSNNFTVYLTKTTSDCMTQLADGLELNNKGEKEAKRIIKLMQDDNAPAGFAYVDRSTSQSGKKVNRMSKEDKAEIDSWVSEDVDLGKLDIRDIKTGRDAALVSLWAITTKLGKTKAVASPAAYSYLKKKFTTVSVTPEAFASALTKGKGCEKWFQKNNDNGFFLSTDGQKLVEDWISGATKVKKEETE